MLRIEDAQNLILSNLPSLPDELVALDQAHGRVLKDVITSDIDLPPFDRARMDGYAVRSSDTTNGSPQTTVLLEIHLVRPQLVNRSTESCSREQRSG